MPEATVISPKFLSLRQFARFMGVGLASAWRWVGQGMPALQPAGHRGRVLIDPQKAITWLEEQTEAHRKATPPPESASTPVPSRTKIRRRAGTQ